MNMYIYRHISIEPLFNGYVSSHDDEWTGGIMWDTQ